MPCEVVNICLQGLHFDSPNLQDSFNLALFCGIHEKYAMWKFIVDVVNDFVSSLQPDVGRGFLHVSNVFLFYMKSMFRAVASSSINYAFVYMSNCLCPSVCLSQPLWAHFVTDYHNILQHHWKHLLLVVPKFSRSSFKFQGHTGKKT